MLIEIRLSSDSASYCWKLFDGPDGIDEASGSCKTLLECFQAIDASRRDIAMSYCENGLPEPETKMLDDGCVEVRIGNISGVVSSYHLVEPKLNQLRAVWKAQSSRWLTEQPL